MLNTILDPVRAKLRDGNVGGCLGRVKINIKNVFLFRCQKNTKHIATDFIL